MANTMQFDLVSPERKLASLEASEVEIPGSEGDFTAMPDHAPVLTTLRPGVLKVKAGSDVTEYVVTGGFVEVSGAATSVLAEQAMPKGEVTREIVEGLVAEAEEAAANLSGPELDLANKRVADTKGLLELV
ncbi:MAG: F0F1 ATP synthase subunit epsilon [Rhodobacteraceae bacterium]|nr:F0F1 ATP synthase subunit epsilon [Paracoccaceae bacterium]